MDGRFVGFDKRKGEIMSVFERLGEAADRAGIKAERRVSLSKEWTLETGMKVVIDPEVGCPMCGEWVRTRRVWLVDEGGRVVVRAWEIGGGRWRDVGRVHPHVGGNGNICMGNAKEIGEALWGRVNLSSVFWDPREWFIEMGHDCEEWEEKEEEEESYYCDRCEESFGDEDDVNYYPQAEESLCDECWGIVGQFCDSCGETVYVGRGCHTDVHVSRNRYESWCDGCLDRSRCCEGCDELWDGDEVEEVEGKGFCPGCLTDKTSDCGECEETFLDESLEEGEDGIWRCWGCRPAGLEELEGKGQINWLDLTKRGE